MVFCIPWLLDLLLTLSAAASQYPMGVVSDPTGMSDTKCSSTDSSEPGIDLEIDSEGESQRASTQKMSRPSEASEVLRASNSQARDVRLTSKELDDCRVLIVKSLTSAILGCNGLRLVLRVNSTTLMSYVPDILVFR